MLIVALIGLGLVALAITLVLSCIAWKLLKGLRAVNGLYAGRGPVLIDSANERITGLNQQLSDGSGVLELALRGYRVAQGRRRKRNRGRARRILDTVSAIATRYLAA